MPLGGEFASRGLAVLARVELLRASRRVARPYPRGGYRCCGGRRISAPAVAVGSQLKTTALSSDR